MAPASSKGFLDIQATVECGFTLKLVRDMIKTYNHSDGVFDKCKELFNNLELDIPETCIDRAHKIGKKTPSRVRPIIVRFTTWRHRTMAYRKRKDCVNCRITLDLTKSRMDILKEAVDLARESDRISYAFEDINCSLYVKLSDASFKFFNTIDDLNNL